MLKGEYASAVNNLFGSRIRPLTLSDRSIRDSIATYINAGRYVSAIVVRSRSIAR